MISMEIGSVKSDLYRLDKVLLDIEIGLFIKGNIDLTHSKIFCVHFFAKRLIQSSLKSITNLK